jgi:hypothetical protein
MKRALQYVCVAGICFISAHRLPAPIVEETTPPPVTKRKTETRSSVARSAPAAEAGMNSRSVQVVLTESTRAAIASLRTYVQNYESMPLAGKSDVHPDEILEQLKQALSTRFSSVSILDGNSPSRSGGLTMFFDLQTPHVGTISFTTNTISFTAIFKSSTGRTIQTISASGKSMVPYPGFFGTQFPKAVSKAFADFSQKLAAVR